jgi:glycosyltransferase involved in cell wall biosynthesis
LKNSKEDINWPLELESDHTIYDESLQWPKISIITPSYNQGTFLEKTIRSVLLQNYPNLEYIIIDGGSTDNSVDIIKKYEAKIHHWVSEKDRGQSDALNKGFERATGTIVAWINSDDYFEKGALINVARAFMNSDADVVNGNCIMVRSNGSTYLDKSGEVTLFRLLQHWNLYFCPPQPSIFFKKELLDKVGRLDVKLNYSMDLELWIRMSIYGKFLYIDQNLSYYVLHDSSKSGSSGGFDKFVPEWRQLSLRYRRYLPLKKWILLNFQHLFHLGRRLYRIVRERF